jgi:hypothetical protein
MLLEGGDAMEILLAGIAAILLSVLLISGWAMLLITPLVVLSTAVINVVTEGISRIYRYLPSFAGNTVSGILCIDGLASEPSLANRLRSDITQVLKLAPPDTHPRACACVKQVEGKSIGVLRVFNTKGHYLLRTSRDTAAAVTERFSVVLNEFKDSFPARVGARRIRCAECDPKTCPLLQLKRSRALSPQAV